MGGHARHPLLDILLDAAGGAFPPVDGGVSVLPPLEAGLEAVMSFTGHAVLATRLSASDLSDLDIDGFGSALHPSVLLRMAGTLGWIGTHDATLVAAGTGGSALPPRTDLERHHRVVHARSIRSDVRVFGDDRGLVTLSTGLAGRTEIGMELHSGTQGRGRGASLLEDALGLIPAGEPVFAAVSPGNARSLRLFLGRGFEPIGSEVLIRPRPPRVADTCIPID